MDSLAPSNRKHALSELDLDETVAWARQRGLPAYRGRQIFAALAMRGAQSFAELTDLPGALRADIAREHRLRTLDVLAHRLSPTDRSEKALFELKDASTVETVLIRSRTTAGKPRLTVCVSSQVGCPAGCTFCATGLSGFGRNLTAAEICDQVMYFAGSERHEGWRIGNVVFMGMGEPLMNARAVAAAVQRLTDPAGLGLGQRHITISTVGIVPQVRKFAEWAGQVNLAISLHAPNDELRSSLVPYNRFFPIADLMEAVREYVATTHRRVSFEYVLLHGVNDTRRLAQELAWLLRPLGVHAHVNLIPWNPFREGNFVRSEGPDAEAFAGELRRGNVNATIRYSKGLDISAACGQLREQVEGKRNGRQEPAATGI
jgi:23S rRNA (adenine2503-C2)-methyltransferase